MNDIFQGTLYHKRFHPKIHSFTYPAFFFGLDCDSLTDLAKTNFFFSYNRFNLFSLYDKDYLKNTNQTLANKVRSLLQQHGYTTPITSITLLTSARCLGYCFNPVSFFYCYADQTLIYIIAEVNNTFGERHPYILTCDYDKTGTLITTSSPKEFYVSPFFDIDGSYEFKFTPYNNIMKLIVDYKKDDKLLLHASLHGIQVSMTSLTTLKLLLTFPWTCFATFCRILFQAFLLKFRKYLPIKQKMKIKHKDSFITKKPSVMQYICMKLILSRLKRITNQHLSVTLPSGLCVSCGDTSLSTDATIWIKDYRFFTRVALRHEIGLGESFMLNEWESDNVKALLRLLLNNSDAVQKKKSFFAFPSRLILVFQHFLNRNYITNSKKNIEKHYDLSNDFFKCFLDDTMMYSCAYYPKKETTLFDAQKEKISKIIHSSDIQPGMRVLEIGSGWGSLAIELATTYDCHVTTVTISKEQFQYVQDKIKSLHLTHKITLLFQDYRHIDGVFDRIISIEMLEAVGHKYLPVYFKKINDLLADSGKAFIQSITIRDDIYHSYKSSTDWIRKYIFPGGHLPSLEHIKGLIQQTNLTLTFSENIGPHYVNTLQDWKEKLLTNINRVKTLGFDDMFIRKWLYYFEYCQAGFSANHVQNYHLIFNKK
tara:strand:- start:24 stop:1976 length:1953 start_codon:yes stop_codon:yes gene_type:complete